MGEPLTLSHTGEQQLPIVKALAGLGDCVLVCDGVSRTESDLGDTDSPASMGHPGPLLGSDKQQQQVGQICAHLGQVGGPALSRLSVHPTSAKDTPVGSGANGGVGRVRRKKKKTKASSTPCLP